MISQLGNPLEELATADGPSHYIAIGASAGGLEAIESFFKHTPSCTGLAYIVIQHLSPDHKSLMAELLSKHTEMPVYRAEEGLCVAVDSVYLIPPKKNLSIFHGKLLLKDQDPNRGINLPIDIFMRSLAEDQGEKAVGIILSGTGSDGTRGIRSIKEAGGMVMVQDEESAKFDGMPKSAIATGLPDFILPPDAMPGHLLSFVKHPYASKAEISDTLLTDEDGLLRIFALLRERSKVDFTYYKPSTVLRRIERRMTVNQIHDLRDYVRFLERFPGEVTTLYRELLIGVTCFFRDKDVFDLLLDKYLPELFNREGHRQIRFWVAGCSTGEEAYSLAILARECMDRMERTLDVKIFATDVDRDAVLHAGNGVYPESITADLNPQLLSKYFYRKDDMFTVARHIREMVVFAQHNLIKDPPFTNIDLVSCRNLLIYLQPVLQRKVLQLFSFSLNDKGVLSLGTSETTGDVSDLYEPLHHKWKLYRSRGKRLGRTLSGEPVAAFNASQHLPRARARIRAPVLRLYEEERVLERLLQALSSDYIPLVLVVNEAMELVHVVGDTEGFFRLPSGKMQNDITRMANKELAIPLATGIQKAFKSREEVIYSNVRIDAQNGRGIYHLRVKPLPEKKGQDSLVLILIQEAHRATLAEPGGEIHSFDLDREAQQRIQDLEQELQFTRENLQATVEELETSNEELQATNEELLASNEELQSTNEELQSVNEELYTVNAEYQSKILELTELNNDLDNLFNSTELAILFLDENLVIRRFTAQIREVFRIIESDVGRPFTHLNHHLQDQDPVQLIRQVMSSGHSLEIEVHTIEGRWYLMRINPYHISPDNFSGFVITLVNITTIKNTQRALQRSEERSALALRSARMGAWDWNLLNGEWSWSNTVGTLFNLTVNDLPKNYEAFLNCIHEEDRAKLNESVQRALHGEADYVHEHRICWPNGYECYVAETGTVIRENRMPVRMVGIMRDITETRERDQELFNKQRQLEVAYANIHSTTKKLEQSEEALDGILHAAPSGLGMIFDDHLQWVNPALLSITGFNEQELVGQPAAQLFADASSYPNLMEQAWAQIQGNGNNKSSKPLKSQWRRKDGSQVEVLLRFAPLSSVKPESGLIIAGLDLSQLRDHPV